MPRHPGFDQRAEQAVQRGLAQLQCQCQIGEPGAGFATVRKLSQDARDPFHGLDAGVTSAWFGIGFGSARHAVLLAQQFKIVELLLINL